MIVIFDTNIINHWSEDHRFASDVELLRKSQAFLTVPATVVEEIIRTRNDQERARLSSVLTDLLHGNPVLAHLWDQIAWGAEPFLSGERTFRPFVAEGSDTLKEYLRNGCVLRSGALNELNAKRKRGVVSWDEMQKNDGTHFRKALQGSKSDPTAWIATLLRSTVFRDVLLERVSNDEQRVSLRARWEDYITWNPICRNFLELFILAIRRNTMEQLTANFKKRQPKWEDHFISAFIGISNRFVTDDNALRSALDEHRRCCGPIRGEPLSLQEFLKQLHAGRLADQFPGEVEFWPPQGEQASSQ